MAPWGLCDLPPGPSPHSPYSTFIHSPKLCCKPSPAHFTDDQDNGLSYCFSNNSVLASKPFEGHSAALAEVGTRQFVGMALRGATVHPTWCFRTPIPIPVSGRSSCWFSPARDGAGLGRCGGQMLPSITHPLQRARGRTLAQVCPAREG